MVLLATHGLPYLPWAGFFSKLRRVDLFVVLDEVPMPNASSLLNRTSILLDGKPAWLTLPINRPEGSRTNRRDVRIAPFFDWRKTHCRTLAHAYRHAPHVGVVREMLEGLDLDAQRNLFDFNARLIGALCRLLDVPWQPVRLSDLNIKNPDPTGRIVEICTRLGATGYVSGAGGRGYLDPARFAERGLALIFSCYRDAPYHQHGTDSFAPGLSIVDRLCWQGVAAAKQAVHGE